MPKRRKPNPNDVNELQVTLNPFTQLPELTVVPRKTPIPEKTARSSKKNRRH